MKRFSRKGDVDKGETQKRVPARSGNKIIQTYKGHATCSPSRESISIQKEKTRYLFKKER